MCDKKVDFLLDLTTTGTSPLVFIATDEFDACSIQAFNPEGSSFNSGVITVKKGNMQAGGLPADLAATPVTITGPGTTELVGSDWQKCGYLVLQATTAASTATRVMGSIRLRKLGREPIAIGYATGGLFAHQHVSGLSGISTYQVAGMANATALSTLTVLNNFLYALPFVAPAYGGTIDQLALNVTTSSAGNVRLGIYDNTSPLNLCPLSLVVDGGAVSTSSTGVKTFTVDVDLSPGRLYWLACVFDATPTVRALDVAGQWAILGSSSLSTPINAGLLASYTYAALASVFPSSSGSSLTSAGPALGYRLTT